MTAETDDVHATPDEIDTWIRFADEVLRVPATEIVRIGAIEAGESGTYAARRIWFRVPNRPDDSLRSALIVAGDEPNEACAEIELEGRSWWPRATWGCEPCSEGCERHRVDWYCSFPADRFIPDDLREACPTCEGDGLMPGSQGIGEPTPPDPCPECDGEGVA